MFYLSSTVGKILKLHFTEKKTENTVVNKYQERKAKELSWCYATGNEEGVQNNPELLSLFDYEI